ncbi:hypothetical protein X734_29000 [Mesorhizobium sp. L2C084A000]|nr:hypothetical protein X734_29000 [Mesorhizobium sp. L2C084A000]
MFAPELLQFGLLRRHGDEYRLERNDFVETGQSASLHDADKSLFCTARGPPFAPESRRHGLSGRRRTPSPFGLSAPVHAFDERHQLGAASRITPFSTRGQRNLSSSSEAQVGEYGERKVAAEQELRRIDIVAPQSGTIQQLAVHTLE